MYKMSARKIIQKVLADVSRELGSLSDDEIQKLAEDGYSVSVKVVRERQRSTQPDEFPQEEMAQIVKDLEQAETREDGLQVLEDSARTRKGLELIAKHLDVSVLKQDKVEYIREKIVEATIGARLRSQAIQGKRT